MMLLTHRFMLFNFFRRDADIYYPYATIAEVWEEAHLQEPSGLIEFEQDLLDFVKSKKNLRYGLFQIVE